MEYFLTTLLLSYVFFVFLLIWNWKKIHVFNLPKELVPKTFISIIVPVRNEAENLPALLQSLDCQNYPKNLYEVLVIDDGSTDGTPEIVRKFIASFPLRLLQLDEHIEGAHKKNAIMLGVTEANGALIATTDGDCKMKSNWLRSVEAYYQMHQSSLIFGGVTFHNEKSFFEKMQTIEFASLTGSGAACLNAGFPNMCNGANIFYEKKIFAEVNGYAGYDQIPSGDDEFLMHKVYSLYPDKVHFIKSFEAVVYTVAQKSLENFIHQRKRWAGKWKYYRYSNIKAIAVYIFLCNLAILFGAVAATMGYMSWKLLLLLFLLKFLPDMIFINGVMNFYKKKFNIFIFILAALFYPFYVSFFAISSNIGKYSWKGRSF